MSGKMNIATFAGHYCLAIIVAFTSTGAVDVYLDEISDYDEMSVFLLQKKVYSCFRHQPTEGNLVTRVLIGQDIEGPAFTTFAPYLDVLIHGKTKYFKIINADWSASTPFIGDKYKYYKVKNGVVNQCDGVTYTEIYRISYRRHLTLCMWLRQTHIDRYTVAEGRISVPKPHVFIKRVTFFLITLWLYDEYKGVVFVKALLHSIHMRTVVTLYFMDLNDNEILMHFIVWNNRASHVLPWKGYPKEYEAPSEKLPAAFTLQPLELIPLEVNAETDLKGTPLLKKTQIAHGEELVNIYITHQDAYIDKFIYRDCAWVLREKGTFLVVLSATNKSAKLQLMTYQNGRTELSEISSCDMHKGFTRVIDSTLVLYSFPLHLGAEVDERMYTKKNITIGGIESVVYTTRRNLAFSQVYFDGWPIFLADGLNVNIEQFILQDSRIYAVIRAVDKIGHERYYRGRDDKSWQRAEDEYPDYILS